MNAHPESRPLVAFGALGGTISMTQAEDSEGIHPTLGADDLVGELANGLGLEVRGSTLQRVGSSSLTPTHLVEALRWAREEVAAGAQGVVISQGTDTLEESAWFAHLLWDLPQPLVFTAAMRGPQAPGADGPANVQGALLVASSPGARERGVLAVLDDTVHSARWVHKAHSSLTGAFVSSSAGPLGSVVEDQVHWLSAAGSAGAVAGVRGDGRLWSRIDATEPGGTEAAPWPWVGLLTAHLDDRGQVARAAAEAGAAGLVVAGTGGGHVSAAAAEVLGVVAEQIPVVYTTRTGSGPALRRTYGYPGAELDLQRRGLVCGGWLTPLQARTALQLLSRAGETPEEVRAVLDRLGRLTH